MAQKVVGLTKNNCGGELSPGSLLYMRGDHPPRCDLVASGLLPVCLNTLISCFAAFYCMKPHPPLDSTYGLSPGQAFARKTL
jgi:hypothetical protein